MLVNARVVSGKVGSTHGARLLVALVVVAPGARVGVALCLQGMVVVGVVSLREGLGDEGRT